MAFTKERTEELKKQLLAEIKKMPNTDYDQIEEYILSLDEDQFEDFLKKNNVQLQSSHISQQEKEQSIFKAIIENKIPSYKIAENEKAIAILEINPLSVAHVLVIPKEKFTIEKIPKKVFSLAQKVAKKIQNLLKPIEVKIETFQLQDYVALNVIPIYANKPLTKEKAKEEDLKKMQQILEIKKMPKRAKKILSIKKEGENKIKPRIPRFY